MRHIRLFCICLFTLSTLMLSSCAQAEDSLLVAGWVEKVTVFTDSPQDGIQMSAKLDTGAKTSSLHAVDIKVDKAHKRVKFVYVNEDGKRYNIEAPFAREVKIKKRPKGIHIRPVVYLNIKIGEKTIKAEVNLTDRSHFNYHLLIGRRLLQQGILVDSSRTFILPHE
ncbi:ATP-dependent zinc protease family protein [Desulfobaculum bizertense]|uniref:Uncharacterized conserved protein n=1 Tax=Desulfobaculum bizertense DSM 18034 TaxID=1121442 RepID=A0A1T4VZA4_9BACT|nr:RimK/LysX family protein [Desulfobaculum bizertense]UIJ37030.1 RimK/LysX family protein [Desulfobaculum bizertense]SKA70340.1 Uncharacterized conserved protein [Desulfobaculum bizertense DSM 18034]